MGSFKIQTTKQVFEEWLATDPLRDYFVAWDSVTTRQLALFVKTLEGAASEAPMQRFLQRNPNLLIEHLGGGHGRWVLPQPRLGRECVPDFVIGEKSSLGHEWYLVELESPRTRMFTVRGKQTAALTHAINQIQEWRAWLTTNQNYAARAPTEGGLGLTEISSDARGLILISRRSAIEPRTNALRRQIASDLRIEIHTYDFLVEAAEGRQRERRGR